MFVIIEDGKVVTLNVDPSIYKMAIKAPEDIVFGDRYENGEWVRCGERPSQPTVPIEKTLEERVAELEQVAADLASLQLEVLMNG